MLETGYLTAKALMMSLMLSDGIDLNNQNVEETYCMSLNIYYEARGESWKGNPIRDMCQFAWYCDGKKDIPQLRYKAEPRKGEAIKPNVRDWEHSVSTAIQVMNGYSRDFTKGATHYYNHNISTPSWSTVYPVTVVVGNHTFLYRTD